MKAILLIDHGSRREAANEMLGCMCGLVRHMVGTQAIVHFAHMELAEPSIEQGLEACIRDGATEVIAFPYMLSPGRHSISDIPRMVSEAAARHGNIPFRVTPPFGVESELGSIILRRAGLEAVTQSVPAKCWNPGGVPGSCGESCCDPSASTTGAQETEARERSRT